jgi:hypothetical protein
MRLAAVVSGVATLQHQAIARGCERPSPVDAAPEPAAVVRWNCPAAPDRAFWTADMFSCPNRLTQPLTDNKTCRQCETPMQPTP